MLKLLAALPVVLSAAPPAWKMGAPMATVVLHGLTGVPLYVAVQVTTVLSVLMLTPVICMFTLAPSVTDRSWPFQIRPARSVRRPLWNSECCVRAIGFGPPWHCWQLGVSLYWRWDDNALKPSAHSGL